MKISCVVDNSVLQGSSYWGEHGLSFYIETEDGHILFDTGLSGTVLLHNLEKLEKTPANIDVLALSHGHNDHTGGLPAILSQKPGLPLYANADFFRPRFTLGESGAKFVGQPLTQDELSQIADVRLNDAPVEILPGLWTTGEIRERPEPEGRSPSHVVPNGQKWQPDPYQDDLSLVLETQNGVVLICGCCHAGLLNTLAHIHKIFQQPIVAILGGTHLVSADDPHLQRVKEVLRDRYNSPDLYLSHCTGIQAYVALAHTFGDKINPFPVGTTLTFS